MNRLFARASSAVTVRRRERAMRIFYAGLIGAGDLVFDVGANVGVRTAVFNELGARVVAIEPHPECVERLRRRFAGQEAVTVVPLGLAAQPGDAELLLTQASTISTMSPAWMRATRDSGRFAEFTWDRSVAVPVTTLDALIEEHGVPSFCKIDVEGYELEVFRGLSRAIASLSFEFDRESLARTADCVAHLEALAAYDFSHSLGESMRLAQRRWVTGGELMQALAAYEDPLAWGDVYACVREARRPG